MKDINIRNATKNDINEVVRLENEIWPLGTRASKDKFISRLEIFSQGFFLAYKNGELIGVSTSEIIEYDSKNPPKSWESITDNGYIRKSHNLQGNALYVVSLSINGGETDLINAQKELAKKLNLKFLIVGSRVPYYYKKSELKIEDYLQLKNKNNEPFDPEIKFCNKCGLKITKIIPNYMQDDKESRNYGVIMIWENPNLKYEK